MSYDIDIEGSSEHFNYTFNLGQLWRDHMPFDPAGVEGERPISKGIKSLDGKTGEEACVILEMFWKRLNDAYHGNFLVNNVTCLDADKAMQKRYDPENGWGSFISALIFTGRLQAECAKFPTGIVHVWS